MPLELILLLNTWEMISNKYKISNTTKYFFGILKLKLLVLNYIKNSYIDFISELTKILLMPMSTDLFSPPLILVLAIL